MTQYSDALLLESWCVQIHLFFLASRLWMRRGFERLHIPILRHKGAFWLAVLQLWTREVILLILLGNGPACCSEVRSF
jgi:hypothetical protein